MVPVMEKSSAEKISATGADAGDAGKTARGRAIGMPHVTTNGASHLTASRTRATRSARIPCRATGTPEAAAGSILKRPSCRPEAVGPALTCHACARGRTAERMGFDGTYYFRYDAEGNRTAKYRSPAGALDATATDITTYAWNSRRQMTGLTHRAPSPLSRTR